MKKVLFTVLILGLCGNGAMAQKTISNTKNIIKISASKIVVLDSAVVPPHQVLYFHSAEGKLVQTYTQGQIARTILQEFFDKLNMKKVTKQDCFKVACPDSAPAGSTCWDCRPATQ